MTYLPGTPTQGPHRWLKEPQAIAPTPGMAAWRTFFLGKQRPFSTLAPRMCRLTNPTESMLNKPWQDDAERELQRREAALLEFEREEMAAMEAMEAEAEAS
jgi:hypothetical protein